MRSAVVTALLLWSFVCISVGFVYRPPLLRPRWSFSNKFELADAPSSRVPSETDEQKARQWAAKPFNAGAYKVGQQFVGKIVSVQPFGVFVEISPRVNVLIPRSKLSSKSYSSLQSQAARPSAEPVKVELITVSEQSNTLTAKLVKERGPVPQLQVEDILHKEFNATVISVHNFGVFARLDGLGIDGLISSSQMTTQLAKGLTKGCRVEVRVESVNAATHKVALSLLRHQQTQLAQLAQLQLQQQNDPRAWLEATVNAVTGFGLFVQPAGLDVVGLVRRTKVPVALQQVLRRRLAPAELQRRLQGDKSDFEALFHVGDVVRVRVQESDPTKGRLELSMQPEERRTDGDLLSQFGDMGFTNADFNGTSVGSSGGAARVLDEDFYADEEEDFSRPDAQDEDEENPDAHFDPESVLMWWQGAPYVREEVYEEAELRRLASENEAEEVVKESAAMREGLRRRAFLEARMQDVERERVEGRERERRDTAEEIGELAGLHEVEDLAEDPAGFGFRATPSFRLGDVLAPLFSEERREEISYFQDTERERQMVRRVLRGGKRLDEQETQKMLKNMGVVLNEVSPSDADADAGTSNGKGV